MYVLFLTTLNLAHPCDRKDEQITRMQPAPTLVRGFQLDDNEKRIRIQDVKEELAAEYHVIFERLQDEFGHIQSAFEKQQQKTGQTLRSFQRECTISHAGLASRVDQIGDDRDILRGDLLLIKNDVNGELAVYRMR